MYRLPAAVLTVVLCAACGDSPVQPSPPAAPGESPTASPVVRFTIRVDESGARDAVTGLSEVSVDASASTGAGALTFAVDFGDGTRVTGATARHVYAVPGTFTVSVEARDSQDRTASTAQHLDDRVDSLSNHPLPLRVLIGLRLAPFGHRFFAVVPHTDLRLRLGTGEVG